MSSREFSCISRAHLIFQSQDYADFVTRGYNVSHKRLRCTLDVLFIGLYSSFPGKSNSGILTKEPGHKNVTGLPGAVVWQKPSVRCLVLLAGSTTIIRTLSVTT